MQIKKFRGADMREALDKVKKDLGTEAIILSTRQVRGGTGRFGLFGRPMLEVTAARELPDGENGGNSFISTLPLLRGRRKAGAMEALAVGEGSESDLLRQMLQKNRMETEGLLAPLQDEIQELKEVLHAVGDSHRETLRDETAFQQMRTEMAEMHQLVQNLALQSHGLKNADFPDNLVVLYQQLIFSGLEEKFARRLIEEAQKNIPTKEIEDFSYVKIFLARMLMKIIRVTGGTQKEPELQKRVALVGPTGVGKTTTVAKLASEQLLRFKRQVALITVDTFRIAAVEQLKVYAKIMGVPITVVRNKAEMKRAIENFSQADVIFIDTGGRSQRDDLQMSEIYQLFGGEDGIDIYLTLSATTKDSDLNEITSRFSEIPLGGIVFTKLDESTAFGPIFNHGIRFKTPIAYLTTGQKVPEDIETASKERLVDLLLNISGN